ncbi:RelA/SpoT family protein [Porphyromonas loveana]|uniref:RelA/SpoT family protein n=3 Tax=Porphyromonas loveana TaxID=1884669 RepID=UPI00359F5897
MTTKPSPFYTTDERARLVSCYSYLLRTLTPDRRVLAEVRHLMNLFVEEGCFDRDKNGMHGFMRNIEVACIATREIGLGIESIWALLFYRPMMKGLMQRERIVALLGEDVARLIDLLLKTSEIYMRNAAINTTNFEHFLLSIAEDIRVVLLIIADRSFLLRNAKSIASAEERTALAAEVSYLYAPLAHRLGLYAIKSEMEDLCLKYTDRQTFDMIKRKLGETKRSRDAYIEAFITPLRQRLDEALPNTSYEMKGRTKSINSIRNKLRKQGIEFEAIYDLFAIRIILDVPEKEERSACWHVYSIITDMYQPNPQRLKDWISIPKSNGYESLHITVMGPQNKWVEVQIRTRRMDEVAERGLAAHWKYKGIKSETGLDEFLTSVRETLEAREHSSDDTSETVQNFKMNLFTDEIYAFTPTGELIKLPQGASVLDFAFAIHSRIGCQAVGANVNGKNVPLKHKLENGDSVSIITSAQQTPKKDWLSYVVSSKARNKIKQQIRQQVESSIDVVKELLSRRLKNRKLPFDEAVFTRIVRRKGFKHLTDFYLEIAADRLDVLEVLELYAGELEEEHRREAGQGAAKRSADSFVAHPPREEETAKGGKSDVLVIDQNMTGVEYSFGKCCNPIYGDQVFGFVSNSGIKIHRTDCPNAPDMFSRYGYRVIEARWSGKGSTGYEATLHVVGQDNLAIVTNITSVINKEAGVSLRAYSINSKDNLFDGLFTVEVPDTSTLSILLRKIRGTNGVKSAERH